MAEQESNVLPDLGTYAKHQIYRGKKLIEKLWEAVVEVNPQYQGFTSDDLAFEISPTIVDGKTSMTVRVDKNKNRYTNPDWTETFTFPVIRPMEIMNKSMSEFPLEWDEKQKQDVITFFKEKFDLNHVDLQNGYVGFYSNNGVIHGWSSQDYEADNAYNQNDSNSNVVKASSTSFVATGFEYPNTEEYLIKIKFVSKNLITLPEVENSHLEIKLEDVSRLGENGGGGGTSTRT